MKPKHNYEAKKQLDTHMWLVDMNYSNSLKNKLKKIVRPTMIVLLVWGVVMALVLIMKLAN